MPIQTCSFMAKNIFQLQNNQATQLAQASEKVFGLTAVPLTSTQVVWKKVMYSRMVLFLEKDQPF